MDELQRLGDGAQETKEEPRDTLLHKGGSTGDMKEKRAPESLETQAPLHDSFWVACHDWDFNLLELEEMVVSWIDTSVSRLW